MHRCICLPLPPPAMDRKIANRGTNVVSSQMTLHTRPIWTIFLDHPSLFEWCSTTYYVIFEAKIFILSTNVLLLDKINYNGLYIHPSKSKKMLRTNFLGWLYVGTKLFIETQSFSEAKKLLFLPRQDLCDSFNLK